MDKEAEITQKEGSVIEGLPFSKVDQIGVVVRDMDKAIEYYQSLGIGPFESLKLEIAERIMRGKPVTPGSMKNIVSLAQMDSVQYELIEPVFGNSLFSEFLETRGEGIHHLGFFVADIDKEIAKLEEKGFKACCPWFENSLRILSLYGVPRDRVIRISAEDAYDTVSEARVIGAELLRRGLKHIILTTSKYHSRRARFIWEKTFANQLSVSTISAKTDPYDPDGWWKEGRQIRWVLAEYGAWIFYYWKQIKDL